MGSEFKSFSGASFDQASTEAEVFAATVAAQSLAVIHVGDLYHVSVGFSRGELAYPVEICAVALESFKVMQLDQQLADAKENMQGDVIGHSFFVTPGGTLMLALMLHG